MLEIETLLQLYLDSLSPKERKGYDIARDHLGSSFSLEKSIGFIQFSKTYKENQDSSSKPEA